MKLKDMESRVGRIRFLLLSVLFLGTVSVFAGNVFVGENGITSNYFSSLGNAGTTQNVSYDNGAKVLVIEDGLIVFVDGNASGGDGSADVISSHATLGTGLVSYYNLDESSGVSVTDSQGLNDGINSDAVVGASGKIGTAYSFKENSLTKITSSVNRGQNFTVSFWTHVNNPAIGHYQVITHLGGSTGTCVNILITSGGGWEIGAISTSTYVEAATPGWNHVVLIADSISDHVEMYLDNTKVADTSFAIGTISNEFVLGVRGDNDGDKFDGVIDEVGVWNRALSSSEISDLYNAGNGLAYE